MEPARARRNVLRTVLALALSGALLLVALSGDEQRPEPAEGSDELHKAVRHEPTLRLPSVELTEPSEADVQGRRSNAGPDGARLSIRASDEASAVALGRVSVVVRPSDERMADGEQRLLRAGLDPELRFTSRAGRLELEVEAQRPLRLVARRTDVETAVLELALEPLRPGELRVVELRFAPPAIERLRARLVDAAGGSGLFDVPVLVLDPPVRIQDGEPNRDVTARTRSDANGCFELEVEVRADPRRQLFVLGGRGYAPRWVDWPELSDVLVDIPLSRSAALEANVVGLADGKPAVLSVRPLSHEGFVLAETLRAGRATFEALPAGQRLFVHVVAENERRQLLPSSVVLATGVREEVAFRLVASGSIEGIVLKPDGEPAPGTTLHFEALEAGGIPESRRVNADRAGRYALVLPAGRYRVRAESVFGWWEPREVLVPEALGEPPVEFELRLEAFLTIEGRVVVAGGRPASFLVRSRGPRGEDRSRVDGRGNFRLAELTPGLHDLQAVSGDFASPWCSVEAGAVGVVLQVDRAAEITYAGRVKNADGTDASARVDLVSAEHAVRGRSHGTEFSFVVRSGLTYGLSAQTDDGRFAVRVLSGAVDERGVELVLGGGATLDVWAPTAAAEALVEVVWNGVPFARQAMQVMKGGIVTLAVPPGPVTVRLLLAGRELASEALDLVVGERRAVVLRQGGPRRSSAVPTGR